MENKEELKYPSEIIYKLKEDKDVLRKMSKTPSEKSIISTRIEQISDFISTKNKQKFIIDFHVSKNEISLLPDITLSYYKGMSFQIIVRWFVFGTWFIWCNETTAKSFKEALRP